MRLSERIFLTQSHHGRRNLTCPAVCTLASLKIEPQSAGRRSGKLSYDNSRLNEGRGVEVWRLCISTQCTGLSAPARMITVAGSSSCEIPTVVCTPSLARAHGV